jgi:2-polyprenyl-3-methyl-5-hydroxy-6-metoxy-1,4-benzoquinol methylase
MLEYARKYPFDELIHQDIENPIATPYLFDALQCIGVLDFVSSIPKMVQKLSKLILPDGCMAITVPISKNGDLNAIEMDRISSLVSDLGLHVVKSKSIFGYRDSETGDTIQYQGLLLVRNSRD